MIEYAIFVHGLAQQWRPRKKRNLAQRYTGIAHSTVKNNRNIIECCNNTHQAAPRTAKQTCACALDLGYASHVTCYLLPANEAGNAFGSISAVSPSPYFSVSRYISLCVCVCPVRALTFESLDLETSFSVCGYIFKVSIQFPISRSWGQSQDYRSEKGHTSNTIHRPICTFSAVGQPSIERQSCRLIVYYV